MRFVLNGRFLGRPVTGVERVALELTRAMRGLLAQRGERDIDVLIPSTTPAINVEMLLGGPVPAVNKVGRRAGHAWEQIDLSCAYPDAWLLSLCNVGPMLRRRQAIMIHDTLFIDHPESFSRAFRWWYRLVVSVVGRRADAVFTVSEFSKASLERHKLVPAGKAHVLRLGIDHLEGAVCDEAILDQIGVRPHGYVLAIGSLARHKNLGMLIDAFRAAELHDVDLVVAGGGNSRVFQHAGLSGGANIRYTGRISDAALKGLYAKAMAFACPSISEGFGLPPLEAMSFGCPVVATTGGAVPEMCGDAAIYADPYDRAAWTQALRRIANDASLRETLSSRSRERAGFFTWVNAARQVLDVLAMFEKQ
ncbi:Glycosyltransferase involved in cell wall bisynthesis [Sphingomonas palmae]|uniref:Glycosyltransferase involved in cell wall bisynthesis n=1 Tax=Sphingomonas palmae TaxID=1855283 RepID=A0A1H7UZU5_9SPHN|nr:glycosyltransferase family 1 protein [Sphingomonas palmae]SEM02309.1 Glycosyltransferase involved in cell wall bisynthesis [Sphingomonas palmae]